jgi:DNA-binding winged helix-turn-helix (wHTH) protein/Tfp pilus assembly protein PilF
MASELKKIYEFGGFRFDAQMLRLEYDGDLVQLPPKSLETLKILLEEKGELITRENLLDKVWAESFVEDANLTVAVSTLRKTLAACNGGETFIQTVPRRGYRFVGDAQETIKISEQPIVVERRAVEHLTIEQTSPSRVYKAIALICLIAGGIALAVWFGRNNTALSAQNVNPAAKEAFQKGDALMQKRLTVCDSISYFREAIAKDEKFASANANLAAALVMCNDSNNEADALVAHALALDSNSVEAHATDGFIKMFVHWDWDEAEAALRRAVLLDPNSAKAHHWLGVLLSIRGRSLEAKSEMARAIEITPESPLYRADLCQIYYFEGNVARAITECQKALELDPNFTFTPEYLRDVYLLAGDEQKAWEYEAKHLLIWQYPPETIKDKEKIFKREGFKGFYEGAVRHHLEQIKNVEAKNRHYHAFGLAVNYAMLGDRENALYWFEQSFDGEKRVYPFGTAYLGVEPRFAFLRDDARFQAILRKMNLAK